LDIEISIIQTSGDWKPSHGETLLSAAAGGKGLFAKEIEMALMNEQIDVGVHSLKDIETFMPDNLCINHVLPREDARDAFISHKAKTIQDLPSNAVVGTSSVRRGAFIQSYRPDIKIVPFRGNVDTRLKKLDEGQVDATLLAAAGLERLGITDVITSYIEPETMLPAVCQGIIGMQIRKYDTAIIDLLNKIHDKKTSMIAKAERAVLKVLDGSCRTPIGSYAQWIDSKKTTMRLRAMVLSPDGQDIFKHEETTSISSDDEARAFGKKVGDTIKGMTPNNYLKVYG
jgi:hydroxymethylbilane synthase